MKAEDFRVEIKKANNSFKKMKQLAQILEDTETATIQLNQSGYSGSLPDMIKTILEEISNGRKVRKSNSSIQRD